MRAHLNITITNEIVDVVRDRLLNLPAGRQTETLIETAASTVLRRHAGAHIDGDFDSLDLHIGGYPSIEAIDLDNHSDPIDPDDVGVTTDVRNLEDDLRSGSLLNEIITKVIRSRTEDGSSVVDIQTLPADLAGLPWWNMTDGLTNRILELRDAAAAATTDTQTVTVTATEDPGGAPRIFLVITDSSGTSQYDTGDCLSPTAQTTAAITAHQATNSIRT